MKELKDKESLGKEPLEKEPLEESELLDESTLDDPKKEKEVQTPTDDELQELMAAIERLEAEKQLLDKNGKKKRSFIAIEFGGVYHHNIYINFVFSFIMNVTLALLIVEVFNFAEYENIYYFVAFIGIYSILEGFIKYFVTMNFLHWIIKSFGFIFYILYLLLFYLLDRFAFVGTFMFNHELLVVAFVTIFIISRYVIGTSIRRNFRRRRLR